MVPLDFGGDTGKIIFDSAQSSLPLLELFSSEGSRKSHHRPSRIRLLGNMVIHNHLRRTLVSHRFLRADPVTQELPRSR
jgi:hypothetical protein